MPKVLAMSGYSPTQIGIIFASAPLVRFILPFAFVKGLKIDRKLFNFALIIMLLSAGSFYISLESFYPLLFSNIFLGVGLSVVLPYIEVVSLSTIGKERYGKVRLYGSVGFVIVALFLAKHLSSAVIALHYLMGATLFSALVAFVIVKQTHNTTQQQTDTHNDISLLQDWRVWLGLTLMQVSFGSFYNFFTIYETDFGISLDMTVYLWSFGVLAEIMMLYFQGRLISQNLLVILQLSTALTALRWFLVYLYPQNIPVLFFSQSLHAFSFALFHSAAISYLYHTYKHKALAQQFFSGITYGMGGFLGALLSGYIYDYFPRELFLSSALIASFACWFLFLHFKKTSNP